MHRTINTLAALLLVMASGAAHAFFINPPAHVYEYANAPTGRYVWLDAIEAASVDKGSAGPGWEATGYTFEIPNWLNPQPPAQPVCRFYSFESNSHFFTGDAGECELLKAHPGEWVYEKIAFYVNALPAGGACPTGLKPVYRFYNDRAAQHDSTHRFTPDPAVRDELLASGWKDEGIAFCTPYWYHSPLKLFYAGPGPVRSPAECESRVGPCLAVKQLPAMPTRIPSFLPPLYVTMNPDFPPAVFAMTGMGMDLYTGQPIGIPGAITNHSFIQLNGTGGPPFGLHIVSADRLAGPYAAVSPMYELPGAAPAAGQQDQRVFPWKGTRHRTLEAAFEATVPTVKRADASSHAYGSLVLQFGDASTGRSFLVTVQAYGTLPPGDFVAPDADTGQPIVSTVFRADPAFGTRLAGDFASCSGGVPCIEGMRQYRFRMMDADFAKALARARTLDPAMSADPADYFLAQVRLHNETYGEAELGATVSSLSLGVWY